MLSRCSRLVVVLALLTACGSTREEPPLIVMHPSSDAGEPTVDEGSANTDVDAGDPVVDVDAGDPVVDVDAGDPFADIDGSIDPRFDAPAVCTSRLYWLPFDIGTPIMRPGETCISCHTMRGRGPIYSFAGTVYPTAHEPAECVGTGGAAGSPIQIEVTDAMGHVVTVTANTSGNFFSTDPIAFPATTLVRYQGRVLDMVGPIMDGECNRCHTPDGAEDAPGRIITP